MDVRLPTRSSCSRLLLTGLLGAVCAALALAPWPTAPANPSSPVQPSPDSAPRSLLLRWTDPAHDWLLVGDRVHDRLAIYDAVDGRPLAVLDRGDGVGDIESMALEGRWLVMLGKGEPRVVRLPGLHPRPLALALR